MAKYILQEILRWLEGLFNIAANYRAMMFRRENWLFTRRASGM